MKWISTNHAARRGSTNYRRWVHYLLLLAFCTTAFPQGRDRLRDPLDNRNLVPLRGTRNPRIEKLTDEGAISPTQRIRGLSLRFKSSAEQAAALEQLLEEQQNLSSPLYHAWVTPEEFGDRFGLSQKDLARVSKWIESQGFQIDTVARSRTSITFSATVGQVQDTFQTELHRFQVDGKSRFANVADARIPAELAPLIHTLRGLDDLPGEPRGRLEPRANLTDGRHVLTPGDLATIYNVNPLLEKGFNGAGQKIVVAGKSALKISDIQAFRTLFGLPKNDPKIILAPGYPDPGINEEFTEVTSDVQIAGATAPNASITYVYSSNAYAAVDYAVDQNIAPIISFSFGGCEKFGIGQESSVALTRTIAQQAIAQGITWVASSGDTGAAGCESQLRDYAGSSGIFTLLPASIPEVTSVGGTMFADGTGAYWQSGSGTFKPTALGYIPETAWNNTTNGGMLATSGGGASRFFARPAWQTGPGVPSGNARLVPDVSFAASWHHVPYMILVDGAIQFWGGTSAGTPFFAGVLSILNQYLVSTGAQAKPGLGNINPNLYQLAQSTTGVFHDITTGDNIIPCQTGTPDCTTGRYGYTAGPGWDAVTGLGSLDVNQFVLQWAGATSTPGSNSATSSVNISIEPSPIYQQPPDAEGYEWYYTVRLTETAGSATRITAFSLDGVDLTAQISAWFGGSTLSARGSLSAARRAKGLVVPSNHVFAFSGVDSSGQRWERQATLTFMGLQGSPGKQGVPEMSLSSSPTTVRRNPKGDPNCSADYPFYHELNLQELNGHEVRLTKFLAGSSDFSNQIENWFGGLRLAPFGTLQARICWQVDALPATKDFEVEGIDKGGRPVKANVQVSFKTAVLIPGTLAISKSSVELSATSGTASAILNVSLPGDEAWTVSTFPANQKSAWLTISPTSRRGPAQVTVTASASGLEKGVYTATLIFQSEYMTPQFIKVPVVFLVGGSAGTTITAAQNAASFKAGFAPGSLMTLYGTNLANATKSATSFPLPLTINGVKVTVNGLNAPLWFVSPNQMNLQIPYETPVGSALVVVNNNGQVASYAIQVTATAPGIFNSSGSIVPVATATRGSIVTLYLTGEGEMNPMLDTGAPPPENIPAAQLPKPRAPVKVTVGGVAAEVTFVGNPWLVGITQVNFRLASNTPIGSQPTVVTVGSVASVAQTLTVQ